MRSVAIANGPGLRMLLVAAAAQAAEGAGLCVAVVVNVVDSVSGHASTTSNAIGFIVLEAVVAVGVAAIAWGIIRVRPWSRTPAVMTQVLTAVIGVWLLQAGRSVGSGICISPLTTSFTVPSPLNVTTRS